MTALCCHVSRFEKESSLWGPYLSMVNGEQARQSDRRYWHLSSDGTSLTEGEALSFDDTGCLSLLF